MERILSQDECAPDALEYFKKDFLKLFEVDFEDWKKSAIKSSPDEGYTMIWDKGNIQVIYSADSPYYEVFEI